MHPVQGSLPAGPSGLYRVWEQAVPLNSAVDAFAGGDASQHLRHSVERTVDRLRRDPRSPLADRKAAIERLQALGEAWERQARMLDAARHRLLAALAVGELAAVAFARQGGAARRLTALPPCIWSRRPKVSWESDRICVDAVTYEAVRIVDPRPGIALARPADDTR